MITILVEKTIDIKINNGNVQEYLDKGYSTKVGDTLTINVTDLPKYSSYNITMQCDCCGNIFTHHFYTYRNTIKNGEKTICPTCKTNNRIDSLYQSVIEYCEKNGYELESTKEDMQSNESKIVIVCPKHGRQTKKIINMKQNKLCYACSREIALKKKSDTTFVARQNSLYDRTLSMAEQKGYKILSSIDDITNNISYIKYECPKHGVHEMRVSNFISGKGCPDCVSDRTRERCKLSYDEAERRISDLGGKLINKYDYKSQYNRNLRILCPMCGNEFTTSLVLFTQHGGQLCSSCYGTESIGEMKVRKYLEENGIKFTQEKWFDDCRDLRPLPFDFYLDDMNTIIEFDGKQHYAEVSGFSYTLEEVQRHDAIKNDYCANAGINLIRIPYWDLDNIEKILDSDLFIHEDIV